MPNILILYGTTEGQTAKIAAEITAVVRGLDHHAELLNSAHIPDGLILSDYDALIIGASIHAGRYQRKLVDFVKTHRKQLEQIPSALFLVSLSAAKTNARGHEWIKQCEAAFHQATGWQASTTAHFAGALKYREYGFIKRWLMQQSGPSDPVETDDWSRRWQHPAVSQCLLCRRGSVLLPLGRYSAAGRLPPVPFPAGSAAALAFPWPTAVRCHRLFGEFLR